MIVGVFLVFWTFVATRTRFGRHVYAVGGNPEAARRAGINVDRIRIAVFMISGFMAGVGGIILASRLRSVDTGTGGGQLLLNVDRGGRDRRDEPLRRPRPRRERAPRRRGRHDGRQRDGPARTWPPAYKFVITGGVLLGRGARRRVREAGARPPVSRRHARVRARRAGRGRRRGRRSRRRRCEPAGAPPGRAGVTRALRDVAAERGLVFRHAAFRYGEPVDPVAMIGGGLCWLDYDDDGWLDLFVVNRTQHERDEWLAAGGLPTSRLFRNERGRFVDVTKESGAGLAVRGQGCVAADLDFDGNTDLFVTTAEFASCCGTRGTGRSPRAARRRSGRLRLAHRRGGGRPQRRRPAGALRRRLRRPEHADPRRDAGVPEHLGVRDLLFLRATTATAVRPSARWGARPGSRSCGSRTGWASSRISTATVISTSTSRTTRTRTGSTRTWRGPAASTPTRPGSASASRSGQAPAGVADPNSGMGVAAADYDGDGRADLFVTNARGQAHAAFRSLPPDETRRPVGRRPEFGLGCRAARPAGA